MNLFGFLEAKVDVGGRIEDRRYPNRAAGDLWNDLAKYPGSVYPVRNPDGTWTGTPIYNFNPLASIKALGRNSTHDRTLQANFQLKERLDFLVEGLYLSEAMSLSSWTRDGASNTRNYSRWLDGCSRPPITTPPIPVARTAARTSGRGSTTMPRSATTARSAACGLRLGRDTLQYLQDRLFRRTALPARWSNTVT